MRNFFIHNFVYKFHRLGFCFYSIKYYYMDYCHKQNKIVCFFRATGIGMKILFNRVGYYEYLEIPVTTKCSLRCRHCSNLIPCYSKPGDYDIKDIIYSLYTYLTYINTGKDTTIGLVIILTNIIFK